MTARFLAAYEIPADPAAFDRHYRLRDLYYPHVGWYNHTDGHVQRFGVWADGQFAWVEDAGWRRELRYKPDTLVTEVRLTHPTGPSPRAP